MEALPASKPCVRCGVDKPLSEFTPHRRGKFGRHSYCRPCNADYVREQNAAPDVRSRNAARQRARRADPAKAEQDRETSARWKQANPDRAAVHNRTPEKIANNKRWAKANPEKRRAQAKRYQARHPEVVAVSQQRRRARLAGAESRLTQAQWREILEEFDHSCAYCRAGDVPLQQEHMTPLARGGHHVAENVVPACGPCNYRKHTKTVPEFLAFAPDLTDPHPLILNIWSAA